MPHVVITGNVIDGLEIHGPFDSREAAIEWAKVNGRNEWIVVQLNVVDGSS